MKKDDYKDPEIGMVVPHKGKKLDYLGMEFHYSVSSQVSIRMAEYRKKMVLEFSIEIDKTKPLMPGALYLFQVCVATPNLDEQKATEFYHIVARGLLTSKRAKPNI